MTYRVYRGKTSRYVGPKEPNNSHKSVYFSIGLHRPFFKHISYI